MAEIKLELKKAIEELRNQEKLKFDQSIDLIINLRKFDHKKTPINTFIQIPHKIKDKKICGFLELKTNLIDTIPKAAFIGYKDKKAIKKLAKNYDFFIASGPLMPSVAATFGKILGPAGKMPSPKLGIIMVENENAVKELVEKIKHTVRVQSKEPSLKIIAGKEKMKNEEIEENIMVLYNAVLNELPNKKENIKSVMIKTTMGKPIRVNI